MRVAAQHCIVALATPSTFPSQLRSPSLTDSRLHRLAGKPWDFSASTQSFCRESKICRYNQAHRKNLLARHTVGCPTNIPVFRLIPVSIAHCILVVTLE